MNLFKRVVSGVGAGAAVFAILYFSARYDHKWVAGLLILIVAYPAAVEYLQLMRRLGIKLAAPEFLIWIPVLALSYVLVPGLKSSMQSGVILLYDRRADAHHDRRVVAYIDGRAEWLREEAFQKKLKAQAAKSAGK